MIISQVQRPSVALQMGLRPVSIACIRSIAINALIFSREIPCCSAGYGMRSDGAPTQAAPRIR